MKDALQRDLDAIARISAVPTILRTVRAMTGLRLTLVARALPDRWIAAAVHDEINFGLAAGGELDVNTTLCREVRDTLEPVIIDEVRTDATYCGHPTPKLYGFQSYIAVPIFRQNGEYFGNICGLDPEPRRLADGKTLAMLRLFSELISLQLDAEERHESGRKELVAQRKDGHLRDQFLAVLGHDVRNPLSSIVYGTELLLRRAADAADRKVLQRMRSEGEFQLRVENQGATIPAEVLETLFQPYSRGAGGGRSAGLGLGLYIVSEIAKAHGGTVEVESVGDRVAFLFAMPCRWPAAAVVPRFDAVPASLPEGSSAAG